MATAILKTSRHGTYVRLSNYGHRFALIPLAVQRGEDPTEAAARAVAEYGFRITTAWDGPISGEWIADVELAEGK